MMLVQSDVITLSYFKRKTIKMGKMEFDGQLEVEEVKFTDAGEGLVLYGGGSEAADPTHANAFGGSYADHKDIGDDSVRFL